MKRSSAIGIFDLYQPCQLLLLSPPTSRMACRSKSKANSTRISVRPVDPGRSSFMLLCLVPLIVSTSGRPSVGPWSRSTPMAARRASASDWSSSLAHGSQAGWNSTGHSDTHDNSTVIGPRVQPLQVGRGLLRSVRTENSPLAGQTRQITPWRLVESPAASARIKGCNRPSELNPFAQSDWTVHGGRLVVIPSLIPSTARTGPYSTDWAVRKRTCPYGLDGCWCLAKVEVAGSNPVIRSTNIQVRACFRPIVDRPKVSRHPILCRSRVKSAARKGHYTTTVRDVGEVRAYLARAGREGRSLYGPGQQLDRGVEGSGAVGLPGVALAGRSLGGSGGGLWIPRPADVGLCGPQRLESEGLGSSR